MLGFLRRGQRWVNALLILVLGGVFVFYMGWGAPSGGSGGGGTLVSVGPHHFGIAEFERERELRERQLEEALGENFDRRQLRGLIAQQAAETLIQRAILALEAERMGLAVSTREVERLILDAGIFQGEDGRFDREIFRNWVEREFGSERSFLASQRIQMLGNKALQVMRATASVSEGEARSSLRQRLEEIRIATVSFDAAAPPEGFRADPAAVEALLAKRESSARELYEQRREEYDRPEQVRARHILISLTPGADEAAIAAAREKALAAQRRIAGGEDFAAVARELSEDPGSKTQGGDLGFFPRGRMVKPFEDAVFSLEPGKLADEPVRSDFGFHVIRVEERKAAERIAFEQVREALAREILADEAALAAARERASRVAERIAAGLDLEDVARSEGLPVERSGMLRRRPDGYVPGLGAAPELLAAAFSLEAGRSSPEVFASGKKLALVKLLERTLPGEEDIASKLAAEREALLEQKQNAQLETWITARRDRLESDGELYVDAAAIE